MPLKPLTIPEQAWLASVTGQWLPRSFEQWEQRQAARAKVAAMDARTQMLAVAKRQAAKRSSVVQRWRKSFALRGRAE